MVAHYVGINFIYSFHGDTRLTIHNRFSSTEGTAGGGIRMGASLSAGVRMNLFGPVGGKLHLGYSMVTLLGSEDREELKSGSGVGLVLLFRVL